MGKDQYVRGMWEYFCRAKDGVKRFREQAEEENHSEVQGQWQLESPAKENTWSKLYAAMTITARKMMRHGFFALVSGEWVEFQKHFQECSESHGMGL